MQVTVAEMYLERLDEALQSQGNDFKKSIDYKVLQDQILSRDLCLVLDTSTSSEQIIALAQKTPGVQHVVVSDIYH